MKDTKWNCDSPYNFYSWLFLHLSTRTPSLTVSHQWFLFISPTSFWCSSLRENWDCWQNHRSFSSIGEWRFRIWWQMSSKVVQTFPPSQTRWKFNRVLTDQKVLWGIMIQIFYFMKAITSYKNPSHNRKWDTKYFWKKNLKKLILSRNQNSGSRKLHQKL